MNKHETVLALRAQAGDREALDQLLKSVQLPLFRYLSRLAGPGEAEDLLQEVFLIIHRKLRWLRDPEFFRPWCYRIASREAFRAIKKTSRRREILSQLPASQSESEPPAEVRRLLDTLPEKLELVSPASRAVIVLHYLHDLTLREVADVLSLSPGTVKSRLAYGLAVLRRSMGD